MDCGGQCWPTLSIPDIQWLSVNHSWYSELSKRQICPKTITVFMYSTCLHSSAVLLSTDDYSVTDKRFVKNLTHYIIVNLFFAEYWHLDLVKTSKLGFSAPI